MTLEASQKMKSDQKQKEAGNRLQRLKHTDQCDVTDNDINFASAFTCISAFFNLFIGMEPFQPFRLLTEPQGFVQGFVRFQMDRNSISSTQLNQIQKSVGK